jgi:pyruvate,water dikinase
MTTFGIIDKTGEMVISIQKLASLARRKTKIITVKTLKKLYKSDSEFRTEFENFVREFGHRGPAEFDIASMNWREDYNLVYNLILTTSDSNNKANRKEVIRNLLHSLKSMERFFVKAFLPRIETFTRLREDGKHYVFRIMGKVKDQLLILEKQLQKKEYLAQKRDIFFLTLQDLEAICDHRLQPDETRKLVQVRKKKWDDYSRIDVPDIIYESGERVKAEVSKSDTLYGTSVSFGKIIGRARIIRNFGESHRLQSGEILVTHHTDPGWTPLFLVASGIVIEVGGVICHAAMVAREFGVPAVVIRKATKLIQDGQMVELDADKGMVRIVRKG